METKWQSEEFWLKALSAQRAWLRLNSRNSARTLRKPSPEQRAELNASGSPVGLSGWNVTKILGCPRPHARPLYAPPQRS